MVVEGHVSYSWLPFQQILLEGSIRMTCTRQDQKKHTERVSHIELELDHSCIVSWITDMNPNVISSSVPNRFQLTTADSHLALALACIDAKVLSLTQHEIAVTVDVVKIVGMRHRPSHLKHDVTSLLPGSGGS